MEFRATPAECKHTLTAGEAVNVVHQPQPVLDRPTVARLFYRRKLLRDMFEPVYAGWSG